MDELRISSLARYTSAFTPLEGPFSCDGSTRALWHLDEFEGMAVFRGVYDTTGNTLVGYNGAHGEGVLARQVHLPLVIGQY